MQRLTVTIMSLALLAATVLPALEAATPPTAPQGPTQEANETGWALFGRAVEDLRQKYRDQAASGPTDAAKDRLLASEIFEHMPLEDLRQIARISRLAEQAARAGRIYMLSSEFRTLLNVPSWVSADAVGQLIAQRVREGKMTEDKAVQQLEELRKLTLESLEFFPDFNRLVDVAIELAEDRQCRQWSLEITYTTPPSNPNEQHRHTYKVDGTWTLMPETGEVHAMLSDPEMSHWAFAFSVPEGGFQPGAIEFNSIEQHGLFHDSIGRWEGRVTEAGDMSGTFRYNAGGCCGSGQVDGTWSATCSRGSGRDGR
jgi:hypothetical protein